MNERIRCSFVVLKCESSANQRTSNRDFTSIFAMGDVSFVPVIRGTPFRLESDPPSVSNVMPIMEDVQMTVRLLDRPSAPTKHVKTPLPQRSGRPDPGYEALSRLARLRSALSEVPAPKRSPWKEPPLFFFDHRRDAERVANRAAVPPEQFEAISTLIAAEMQMLCASVEARRVARSMDGLQAAALALAPGCPAAKDLVDLLAVPDDEAVLVLHPQSRAGFRLTVRGIADVGQFHILMTAAISSDLNPGALSGRTIPDLFVTACRNSGPPVPAGVPMVMEARFQLYSSAAIQPDGTLPQAMGGCGHWLWPTTPLAAIPRIDGLRVVLLGPPAYRAKWEVRTRFSGMPAELRVVDTLGPFQVAEQLSRLIGKPISPSLPREQERELSKAA